MNALPTTLVNLTAERVALRAMQDSDADALFAIYGDSEVMRYASDPTFPSRETVFTMLTSVRSLLAAGSALEWAITDRNTNQLVGTCGIHSLQASMGAAELGCMLARQFWGKGYMHEALFPVIDYSRESLGLIRLLADIDTPNTRSIRLFQRLGFRHVEGTIYCREL
ncbi:MAG: GNAT family N-acetyltransferase [Chloroflexales bacterium]|nr:GNAT family N-acetyltransferase [Chloroflexales bacterium]